MAGLTDQGFIIKRLADILADDRALAVQLFQDLIVPGDIVDVSDSSALGRLISLASPSDADLWEAAQEVYSAFDTNSATGIALDNLVAFAGLVRNGETNTISSVLVGGDTNTLIPLGKTVSSSTTNNQFTVNAPIGLSPSSCSGITVIVTTVSNTTLYTVTYSNATTTNNISFTSSGSATPDNILAGLQAQIVSGHPSLTSSIVGTGSSATLLIDRVDIFQTLAFTTTANLGIIKVRNVGQVVAVNAGPMTQPVGTIDTIVTPVLGWDSVTNPVDAVSGQDEETDEELRLRFREGKFEKATNSYDAVYSALLNLTTVTEVKIYENDTDVTDSNGILPHSFMPIVVGGVSQDIGQAIWDNRPTGIISYGNTTVSVTDVQGFPHTVAFSRPAPVPVYITISRTTNSQYPANGDQAIQTALVNYFSTSQSTGSPVVYSRLYTPINSVPGFQVNSLFIGTLPSPTGTTNISIPFNSVATINSVNIIITS